MSTRPSRKLPLIANEKTIRDLLCVIDQSGLGVALVVDEAQRLQATLTDGDVRRAILLGIELDATVAQILLMRKDVGREGPPITAPLEATDEEVLQLMTRHSIRQIPIVDSKGRVVDIALDSDYLAAQPLPMNGFVMAGGFGKRLMPLTEKCPKPMLPVNGKPLLEHLVQKLQAAGIQHVSISTHYLAESIVEHFHDGKEFGVHIEYFGEDRPMGTAGALAKVAGGSNPLLVVNGDILTSVDFRAMLEFHREHSAEMTIAVQQHETQIPYGVITTEGVNAIRIVEKPRIRNFINAGIYLIQPSVCDLVPSTHTFDMPDLITSLISMEKRVICFPIHEYWLDVGQLEQYERASVDAARGIV